MRVVAPIPPTSTSDVWVAAQLFYHCAGWFNWASAARFSWGLLEQWFRASIARRCSTHLTRNKVTGIVSSFVDCANIRKSPFRGREAVFILSPFLPPLYALCRAESIPARWELKVLCEILPLELPLFHPAVMAIVAKGDLNPIPQKQAPISPIEAIRALDLASGDRSLPRGVRVYASVYILMVLAPLRFSDTNVVIRVWATETASGGRSRVRKRRVRPIIVRAAPTGGISE